jgi:quercetin dioxygenase-like cupin family protein
MTKYKNGYVKHTAKGATWTSGHRSFFEYRDLELGDATDGKFFAQVIKAKQALDKGTGHHAHDVQFQWVYITKGWVEFEFKDVGLIRLDTGDSHYMPEGCHHELMACSDDLEMIEMYSPGQINDVEIPDWRK